MAKHVALKVYDQYKQGDSIKTEELNEALSFFKSVADSLVVLGPVFHLAFVEANQTYMALNGFAKARADN